MKKRLLNRRSSFGPTIHFPSMKNQTLFHCDSQLENAYLYRNEFDENIVSYEAQPFSIPYINTRGRKCRYTPDVSVVDINGEEDIIEIKPEEHLNKEKNQSKFEIIKTTLANQGKKFTVVTEKDIYIGDTVDNYRFLYKFLCEPLSEELVKRFIKVFSLYNGPLGQLQDELDAHQFPSNSLFLLMAHGHIEFDHSVKISSETMLTSTKPDGEKR